MPSISRTALLALISAAISTAAPVTQDQYGCPTGDTNPQCNDPIITFSSLALRSGSPIHFEPLNARDNHIYVGGKTSSYCPTGVKGCPKGNTTVFDTNGKTGTASLDVEVPGGQQLYVQKNGALAYTIPHSGAVPEGSYTSGFGYLENPHEGEVSTWSFTGAGGATGLLACKTKDGEYQVFANVKGFQQTGCLGFDAAATKVKGPGAWEYA